MVFLFLNFRGEKIQKYKEVIRDIEIAMPLITDPELSDNCKSLLLKLQAMSDGDFDDLDL